MSLKLGHLARQTVNIITVYKWFYKNSSHFGFRGTSVWTSDLLYLSHVISLLSHLDDPRLSLSVTESGSASISYHILQNSCRVQMKLVNILEFLCGRNRGSKWHYSSTWGTTSGLLSTNCMLFINLNIIHVLSHFIPITIIWERCLQFPIS